MKIFILYNYIYKQGRLASEFLLGLDLVLFLHLVEDGLPFEGPLFFELTDTLVYPSKKVIFVFKGIKHTTRGIEPAFGRYLINLFFFLFSYIFSLLGVHAL